MNNCPLGLTTAIGAAAAVISKNLTPEEIEFLAAVLVQLGDTLITIATQQALCENKPQVLGTKENDEPCNKTDT